MVPRCSCWVCQERKAQTLLPGSFLRVVCTEQLWETRQCFCPQSRLVSAYSKAKIPQAQWPSPVKQPIALANSHQGPREPCGAWETKANKRDPQVLLLWWEIKSICFWPRNLVSIVSIHKTGRLTCQLASRVKISDTVQKGHCFVHCPRK